jgi:hypothetical protein
VVLRGRGHGHGVGLCQEGAARRARAGAGWREILAAYFPGASAGRGAPHGAAGPASPFAMGSPDPPSAPRVALHPDAAAGPGRIQP